MNFQIDEKLRLIRDRQFAVDREFAEKTWVDCELVRAEAMPENWVEFGCSDFRNKEEVVKLHPMPLNGKSDSEKKKKTERSL